MADISNDAIEAAFSTPGGAYLPSDFDLWWKPGSCETLVGVRLRARQSPYPLTPIGELSDAAKAAIRAALKGEAQP